jgi:hypothetical protein
MMRAPLVAALVSCSTLLAWAPRCAAADAPPAEAPAGAALVSEDEKWVFNPTAGRPDVFYDEAERLRAEKAVNQVTQGPATPGTPTQTHDQDDPLEIAKQAVAKIEVLVSQRNWTDALKVVEPALKRLSTVPASNVEVTKYVQLLKGYQEQIQDALLRDQAQAAFDALNLKVEGILWSENGPRLALISGESRPLGVNDRVLNGACVIINIDTDRVDFRFHFNRKRFEFPRYIGEEAKK